MSLQDLRERVRQSAAKGYFEIKKEEAKKLLAKLQQEGITFAGYPIKVS